MANLTQHVIRFLKNENLYQKGRETLGIRFYLYDTLIDDIVRYNNLKSIVHIPTMINITIPKSKWLNYMRINNVSINNISLEENYFNIVTPILKSFLKEYHIEKEYITIIKKTQDFNHNFINDNDIDKIMRKHQVVLSRLFSSSNTFCNWGEYDNLLNSHNLRYWCNVNIEWKKYLLINNIPDLVY